MHLGPDTIVNDEVGGDTADLLEGSEEENATKNTGTSIVLSPRYTLMEWSIVFIIFIAITVVKSLREF